MTPSVVIFDIGNVLIEWIPEDFYIREIGRTRQEQLFAAVDLHEMNNQVDMGADFKGTIYDWADAHPEWGNEIRMWHDRWLEVAGDVIEHSVRMMRALRAKDVPVHALTNFGVGSFELALGHFDFLGEFDIPFVSGRMQLVKPDPAIYAAVEAELGLPTDQIFFTDDRADNIAVAKARGWQTHQFQGADGLAEAFVALGLLTEEEAA